MSVSLWPPTSQSHIIHLLNYNEFGNVEVSDQHTTIATIPPASTLRTAHILIPADVTERVIFRAMNAQLVADRIIGFIVIDMHISHARLAFTESGHSNQPYLLRDQHRISHHHVRNTHTRNHAHEWSHSQRTRAHEPVGHPFSIPKDTP